MYDDELKRVTRTIKIRNALGRLKEKEIYLFGVSDNTRQIIQLLRELGIEPRHVIDNDRSKQGSYCSMLKVIPIQAVEKPEARDKLYIMYSAYWREMMPQLLECGIRRSKIWQLSHKDETIIRLLLYANRGRRLRKQLVNQYGNVPIFLCPYTGTGDIYLIGTFWNEYIKKNNINEYIFVVINGACKKVASLFNIKNVVLVNKKKDASRLIRYYLYDPHNGNIKVLNDCWAQIHTNQVEWFRGYKGLYFTELFRRFVFNLPDEAKPVHPVYKDESARIESIFDQYELVYGKTVILSPYSNTLSDLPYTFWETLASELANRGYQPITNSGGKTEPAINGTKGICFPLDIAPQFVEAAGYFIGVRTGFCDVISGSGGKKIILYDSGNRFYMGSAFEYFSLKTMGLCNDAVEILFDSKNIEQTIQEILKNFNEEQKDGRRKKKISFN